VLEALAWACALDATGSPSAERRRADVRALASRGRAALLAAAVPSDDDRAEAVALARAGLALLGGQRPRTLPAGDLIRPSPRRVAALLAGTLDGLSAASCALALARTVEGRAEIAILSRAAEGDAAAVSATTDEPLALAAQEAQPMRSPREGRRIARLAAPEVEAVLFERRGQRELAVYGTASEPVRLVADCLTPVDFRGGYFLCSVAPRASLVNGQLHAGDRIVPWTFALAADRPRKKRAARPKRVSRRGTR
jgi:hypothetical protein